MVHSCCIVGCANTKPSCNILLYLAHERAVGSFCIPYVIAGVFTLFDSSNSLIILLREVDSLSVKTLCILLDVIRPSRCLCQTTLFDCFTVAFSRFAIVSEESWFDKRSTKLSSLISFLSMLALSKIEGGSLVGTFISRLEKQLHLVV